MDFARGRTHESLEGLDVGVQKFAHRTVFEYVSHHWVFVQEFYQSVLIGGIFIAHPVLCLDFRVELQFLKEQYAYLFGRQDIELWVIGLLPDFVLN